MRHQHRAVQLERHAKGMTRDAGSAVRWAASGWDRGVLWLPCRVSAGGATHETSDRAQAARSTCCAGCCATSITPWADASRVDKIVDCTSVGSCLLQTCTIVSREAGGRR